jgi:GMP synthase (glutamine-hydrolysing)
MKLLIIDNTDPADAQFNDALIGLVSELIECDVVNYTKIPTAVEVASEYGGIILSGVPRHYSFASIHDRLSYFEWIQHTDLPVLGICLAHEAIGVLFGASILADKEAESGMNAMTIIHDDPILRNVSSSFEAYTLHRASITVPDTFELLVSSVKCKNEIMKHVEKTIYGFQFHPELSSDGETIFKNFIAIALEMQG